MILIPPTRPRTARLWVAVVLLGLYLLTYSGRFHGIDEIAAHVTVESLAREGDFSVDQFRWALDWTPTHLAPGLGETWYSKRGLAFSLAFLPAWLLARAVGGIGLVQATALVTPLATVATALLLMRLLADLGASPRRALGGGLLYGLATPAWPYARLHYSEPLTALVWLAALWLCHRGRDARTGGAALGSGLLAGLGGLIHSANLLLLPLLGAWWGWVAWRTRRPQPLLRFALGTVPPLLVLGWFNGLRFGHPLASPYTSPEERFVWDYARSLPALLLSPGKGIVWFAPIVVVALAGWRGFWRENRPLAMLVAAWIAATLALYGGWFMWWGGWSWGPRYLVPLLPLLLLPLAWLPRGPLTRAALLAVGVGGFGVNALGALVDFNAPLVALTQAGLSDADAIWRWEAWPPLAHARLLAAGSLDVAWAQAGGEWVALALLALLGLSVTVRWRPAALLALGAAMLLVAWVGAAQQLWDDTDRLLREVNAAIAAEATANDRVLVELVPYYDYFGLIQGWMNRYKARPPYGTVLRGEAPSAGTLPATGRLWLVVDRTPPGDPASAHERWLLERGALLDERWFDTLRVVRLVARPPLDAAASPVVFANGITLTPTVAAHGELTVVALEWAATAPPERDLTVFVQALTPDGTVVAQHDRPPLNGLAPTSTWQPGTVVQEGYALPTVPGGTLLVGLYDPATGQRVPLRDGGDAVEVGRMPAALASP